MTSIVPVILSGGSGTRLWPRSRADRPKPFLPLVGTETLFEQAVHRYPSGEGFTAPLVVAGAAHVPLVEAQLAGIAGAGVVIEPCARNTAPAIALAALRVDPEAVLLVCPSDHHIGDAAAFVAAARQAAALAREGWLVSFGIEARSPETGYGYLKRGAALGDHAFQVERFVEKPNLERARAFLTEGDYAWNGGIFAFRAATFLAELARHRPDMAMHVTEAVRQGHEDGARFHPDAESFAAITGESVDYAVMENTARAAMVPVAMDWSDIGNWQALHAARRHDDAGNSVQGRAELVDCRNVLVESDGPRVSVIGLDGVIIVVDGDEVLVTSADGAQQVGKLAGSLNQ